jgi:DNA-binding NtrC family response regulator
VEEKNHRGKRVLIVDDEAMIRDVLSFAFEENGLIVAETEDGEGALKWIKKEKFDLLVVDKNLPGINGLEVIQQAKKLNPKVGTLLMTGYASRQSAEKAMTLGVDDYLIKPFDMDEMVQKVDEILGSKKRKKEITLITRRPNQCRILICDPDNGSRQKLIDGVHSLGCRTKNVEDLEDVLDYLEAQPFDGLICDLDVVSSGDGASDTLRSMLANSPEISFVAVASDFDLKNAVNALKSGARKVIYRPFESEHQVEESLKEIFA